MAITAKINMVLHGDGSLHIFKYDALKRFSAFAGDKLKPLGDPYRSIPKDRYPYDLVETFDAVVSNPPFSIRLASDTKAAIPRTFSTRTSASSECFFLERWFQLLKPKGRLGVVVPESLLNSTDNAEVRLFLYRAFWIRAIVSLPRNLFIETPTLTSLLFAQKKSADEIIKWDRSWSAALAKAEKCTKEVKHFLETTKQKENLSPIQVQRKFLDNLSPIVSEKTQIIRKGRAPVNVSVPNDIDTCRDACRYYLDLLKLAGFRELVRNSVFNEVCTALDYTYPVYEVEEVGYKLSKRKERLRPNQLCRFVDVRSGREMPNLHLANAPLRLEINMSTPERVIDYIRRDVKWS